MALRHTLLALRLLPPLLTLPVATQAQDKPAAELKGSIRARLEGHMGYLRALAYSPDGRTLAAGDSAGDIKLWDTRTDQERATLPGRRGIVKCLAFSPDGQTLASGSLGGVVRLWDVATGQEQASLLWSRFSVSAVAFSPDGNSLAAGESAGSTGAVAPAYPVTVWAARTYLKRDTLEGHQGGVLGLAFTPDSQTLAVSSEDGTLKLWTAATGKFIAVIEGAGGGPLAITPDGKTILCAAGRQVTLTDVATRTVRAALQYPGTKAYTLALSADGRLMAAGGYAERAGLGHAHPIQLWDLSTAKGLATLAAEGRTLDCLALSPDGKTLASGGMNRVISLWKLERQPTNDGKSP
jgi:WD40 repeat protein